MKGETVKEDLNSPVKKEENESSGLILNTQPLGVNTATTNGLPSVSSASLTVLSPSAIIKELSMLFTRL
jgi:hypothetical protein